MNQEVRLRAASHDDTCVWNMSQNSWVGRSRPEAYWEETTLFERAAEFPSSPGADPVLCCWRSLSFMPERHWNPIKPKAASTAAVFLVVVQSRLRATPCSRRPTCPLHAAVLYRLVTLTVLVAATSVSDCCDIICLWWQQLQPNLIGA